MSDYINELRNKVQKSIIKIKQNSIVRIQFLLEETASRGYGGIIVWKHSLNDTVRKWLKENNFQVIDKRNFIFAASTTIIWDDVSPVLENRRFI